MTDDQSDPAYDPTSFHLPEAGKLSTERIRFVYDRFADTLDVDFYGDPRPAVSVAVDHGDRDYLYLRVDPTTREVVGVQIEAFLAYAIKRTPDLLPALAVAELHGYNVLEAARIRRRAEAVLHGQWDAASFVAGIGRMTA